MFETYLKQFTFSFQRVKMQFSQPPPNFLPVGNYSSGILSSNFDPLLPTPQPQAVAPALGQQQVGLQPQPVAPALGQQQGGLQPQPVAPALGQQQVGLQPQPVAPALGPPAFQYQQHLQASPQVAPPTLVQQQIPFPNSKNNLKGPFFVLSNNEKSFVEYKNYVFYFNSHLEHAKPIVLNKAAAQQLVLHLKQLEPFVLQQKANIEHDLTINAQLLQTGHEPVPPKEHKFYQVSLSQFKHFDIRLEANVYQNNIYIWLRVYFQDKQDPTLYRPCKGGTLFGEDQYLKFEEFFNKCK
jgi:hypothetical protein